MVIPDDAGVEMPEPMAKLGLKFDVIYVVTREILEAMRAVLWNTMNTFPRNTPSCIVWTDKSVWHIEEDSEMCSTGWDSVPRHPGTWHPYEPEFLESEEQ